MCVQLCHPIALPLSRSPSLCRGGILLHCVFSQELLLIKDIWVSIGYVQKHVAAHALQTFALARARRISNASVIHPLSNKMTSHGHVFIKAQTNCVPQKSSFRIHCPFVSMVKLIWTKKALQLIFGEFFKRLVHFQSWSLTYFE